VAPLGLFRRGDLLHAGFLGKIREKRRKRRESRFDILLLPATMSSENKGGNIGTRGLRYPPTEKEEKKEKRGESS